MLRSTGMRVSLAGGFLVFLGGLSLLVMPRGVTIAALLAGGTLVWGGFLWTLFKFYMTQPEPRHED